MKHLFLSLLSFLLLLSCSKSDDNENTSPTSTNSLPVKTTHKNANGILLQTSTLTYNNQKRLSKLVIVDQNPNLSAVHTFSYESGKITQIIDWADATKPLEKHIYFYDSNGMKKEEEYQNNALVYIYDWYYRTDGGKERRIKSASSGNLLCTLYYRFSATGNIERYLFDYVDPTEEDIEYTFSNYDNKIRAIASLINNAMPSILLGFNGTNLPAPNNPQAYTYKSLTTGNIISSSTIEYTYNNKDQVTVMKIKNAASGALLETRTIEYQEF